MRGNTRPFRHVFSNQIWVLEKLEQLNPQDNKNYRNQFLSNIDRTDSTLEIDARQAVESLLVEFHVIFARHRFDIESNTEFKVQLTPMDDRPPHNQNFPTPILLRDDILLELALLHKHVNVTSIGFSKYASPISAQRKAKGKLGLLVDLQKLITLIVNN